MQALSAAARLSELERDAAESRAMLVRERTRRIWVATSLSYRCRTGEARRNLSPRKTLRPCVAPQPGEEAGYEKFDEYVLRENELGDEGEN